MSSKLSTEYRRGRPTYPFFLALFSRIVLLLRSLVSTSSNLMGQAGQVPFPIPFRRRRLGTSLQQQDVLCLIELLRRLPEGTFGAERRLCVAGVQQMTAFLGTSLRVPESQRFAARSMVAGSRTRRHAEARGISGSSLRRHEEEKGLGLNSGAREWNPVYGDQDQWDGQRLSWRVRVLKIFNK